MIRYPITVELLSETIFGNGESKNGIVNTEILLDENGFPYFLGKTFKGNMRNSVEKILKPYYKDDFENISNSLFGVGSMEKSGEGKLRFTNFYLHKDIVDLFLDYRNDKDIIMPCLTDIRYAIKINDNGVSEDKSLRAARVLKKGLIFVGFIESDTELDKSEIEFINMAVNSLKNLGVHKSRGKGSVKLSLLEKQEVDNYEYRELHEDEFDYIFYELDLKEPVKIGDSQAKYDYEESKFYITGSSVRGALLNRYSYMQQENDKDFEAVLKNVGFYDAYPICTYNNEKNFSFPTPNLFRITKDRDKSNDTVYKKEEFSMVFDDDLNCGTNRKIKKLKKGVFSFYLNNRLYQFNVKKDFRFHHSRQKDKSNIFRYEAIAKNQKFYGIIDVSNIEKKLKMYIYKDISKNNIFYLGGSRTGGYGKVLISNVENIKDFDRLKEKLQYFNTTYYNDDKSLYIYFLSSTVLKDKNHQITQQFERDYLNKKLDLNLSQQEYNEISYEIEPAVITGFNTKWKSSLPQVYGIENGSTVKIKCENKIKKVNIDNFVKEQHGDRKQDGFGRVIINPAFLNIKSIEYIDNIDNENHNADNEYYRYSKVAENNIEIIKNRIDEVVLDERIKKYIADSKNKISSLNNTQVNNVISTLDLILNSKGNHLDELKNYIERLKITTENNSRNKANQSMLSQEIFDGYNLNSICGLCENKESIRKVLNKLIGKVKENDVERVFLNLIRDSIYYSLKKKNEGENSEAQ
jgi:CRISPR-associated protein Csx10